VSGYGRAREGDQVFGSDNELLGTVEAVHGDGIHVEGQHIPGGAIGRVAQNKVYLRGPAAQYRGGAVTGRAAMSGTTDASGGAAMRETAGTTGTTGMADTGEVRDEDRVVVPVAEERLHVETQEAELGAVEVRKVVAEEQQTVPVELQREEVRVEQRDIPDRPLDAADAETLFEGGTIRVPVRGEEAVVSKEAVVTGEVVIEKEQVTQREQVTETVRREQVEVDENYRQARVGFQEHFDRQRDQWGGEWANRTFEDAEPHYQAGYLAGRDERFAGQEFDQAEPSLRDDREARGGESGDDWTGLREQVREGWDRARAQDTR
jgi:uncharacterized protein (TIGR02271 family)